jgi:hypothetical protein
MKPDTFREPVSILVGLGFPAEVCNVMDAYHHLTEWPASLRETTHSAALNACQDSFRGVIDAESARDLYVAFAEKHELLSRDPKALVSPGPQLDSDPHVS